jgi:hypothetical protein
MNGHNVLYDNAPLFSNAWVEIEENFISIGLGNGVGNPIVKIQKLIQKIHCSFKHNSLN